MFRSLLTRATLIGVFGLACAAQAQTNLTTNFTYQGRLTDAGVSPTDVYDFNFRLFDAAAAGTEILPAQFRNNVAVSNGLFTVQLDWGSTFQGDRRFLQIEVRPGASGGAFTPLTPRQELTAAPYALGLRLPFVSNRNVAGSLFDLNNAGGGRVGLFSNTNLATSNSALRVDSVAPFPALYAIGLAGGTRGAFLAQGNNADTTVVATNSTTTGSAGSFENTNAANTGAALYAQNSGSGPALLVDGLTQLGSSAEAGRVNLIRPGTTGAQVDIYTTANGGNVDWRNESGNVTMAMEADVAGTGGFLAVYRDNVNQGFRVDGNAGGGESLVSINGAARSASFNMAVSGNGSVVLPTDAISDTEILDEPGVASITTDGVIDLVAGVQTVSSRTITCPTSGFVLAIASCQLNLLHTNGTLTQATIGVSDAAGAFPINQDVGVAIPASAPTGNYFQASCVHGLFNVSAGAHTFFFLASEDGTTASINDSQFSLVFFPTAYGTVSGTFFAPDGADDFAAYKARAPLSFEQVAAERENATQFNNARIARELAEMKAHIAELERAFDNNRSANSPQHTVPTPAAPPIRRETTEASAK